MEGSDVVMALSSIPSIKPTDYNPFATSVSTIIQAGPTGPGFGSGPNGVAYVTDSRVFVHNWLDQTVRDIDITTSETSIEQRFPNDSYSSPLITEGRIGAPVSVVASPAMDPDMAAGRRLFYTATDTRMVLGGAAASCASCHTDGRVDGLTWPLAYGPRQTPSLVGGIADTAPFTWTQLQPTIQADVQATSTGRMGGSGVSDAEATMVADWIDIMRPADMPGAGSSDPAVLAGEQDFEASCSSCHAAPTFTDGLEHAFGNGSYDTPSIRGAGETAPYLHDGSVKTLEELLQSGHGTLPAEQVSDVSAYIRTL
jgi:mono/diheme cytochrome c family protein